MKSILTVAFILSWFVLLSGCSNNMAFTPPNIESNHSTIPLVVALSLNPDDCDYTYSGLGKFEFESTFCDYAQKIVESIFSKVYVGSGVVERTNIDLIIKPKLLDMAFFRHEGIPLQIQTVIIAEWQIIYPNGELVSIKSIKGSGIDERVFGGETVRIKQSFRTSFDDLFKKSLTYLMSSAEIKQLVK